jgi:hypothetical protein
MSQATATGGGSGNGIIAPGGSASAHASAGSTGSGAVQANASAFGGTILSLQAGVGGSASAYTSALNQSGEVITTASGPGGYRGPSSALTSAEIGSGLVTLGNNLTAGRVFSIAIGTHTQSIFGEGAMSAAYGGVGPQQQYEATAVFDFTTPKSEALDLKVISDIFNGIGFDNLELLVFVGGNPTPVLFPPPFTSLVAAENFFAPGHELPLGKVGSGSQSVKIEYLLTYNNYNNGASDTPGSGFGFTYDLIDQPLTFPLNLATRRPTAGIPEPSTLAMMLIGFTGLAFVGYRARVRTCERMVTDEIRTGRHLKRPRSAVRGHAR